MATSLRPGRLLVGWLDESQAVRLGSEASEVWHRHHERTHWAVAARRDSLEQLSDVTVRPFDDGSLASALALVDPSLNSRGLRPAIIELSEVLASQSLVALDDQRVVQLALDPTEGQLLELCLPVRLTTPPITAYDERAQSWIIRSPGGAVEVIGRHAGGFEGLDDGSRGFGFIISAQPSRLIALELNGRLVLRDGHHRAVALLKRGITKVPALVGPSTLEDFTAFGSLSEAILSSPSAPRLTDYFDDNVSAEVAIPRSERVVIVQATELDLPG